MEALSLYSRTHDCLLLCVSIVLDSFQKYCPQSCLSGNDVDFTLEFFNEGRLR